MIQRVLEASVTVDEKIVGKIDAPGLLVYLGVTHDDTDADVAWTARKGRRPTWQAAAPGDVSEPAYDAVCAELRRLGAHVETGVFGADMRVASVNDGPVTMIIESP